MNYNISDFSGWMSQDDTFLWKGQCIFQQGIDTIRYPWEIRLMPPLTYSTQYNSEEITSIFSPVSGTIWCGTGDWKVRNYTLNEVKMDTLDTRDIIDGILFRGYFYIFSNRYVYKTTYTSGSLSALSTFYDQWSTNGNYAHPVIYASNEMYFPSANRVRYVDEFGNLQVLPQEFSTNVRAISISGNTLRVYTENTLAIIDVGTKTVSYSQQLPFVVSGLATDWIADYVTTDGDELYVCSGLEWRKLASYEFSETLDKYPTEVRDKFTFRSSNNGKTMCCANWRVFTLDRVTSRAMMYGTKMQGLPNAFQFLPKHDNESSGGVNVFTVAPRSIFAQNNKVYIGYSCNGQERIGTIDFNSTDTACYEGTYMFSGTDLWDYSVIKSIEEIRVGKEWINAELWVSIDNGNFVLLDDLDQTEIEHKIMDYKKDFREITFMVKLYSQFDKIKNISLRYNQRQV